MMNRLFVLIIIYWGGVMCGMAQNRGIAFEPKNWKQAVAKAKKENKLIFLDCYTSWCGPCKNMAENIFTQEIVGQYYNKHFVNVKLDMEKDVDGVMVSKMYKPNSYPTFLFIDPYTELVVHRVIGGGDAQYVLSIGGVALNSDNTLAGACKRYKKGDHSLVFVRKLMNDLKLAGDKEMHRLVTDAYFSALNEHELQSEENWELFKTHVDNPYAAVFRTVSENRKRYETLFGVEDVSTALQWVVIIEMGKIATADKHEAKAGYQKLIRLMRNMDDFQMASALLIDTRFSESLLDNCGEAWNIIHNAYQYNLEGNEDYAIPFFALHYPLARIVSGMPDSVILSELLSLVKRISLRCSSMPYLARLALNRSLILEKSGDKEGAIQARREYEQYCSMR